MKELESRVEKLFSRKNSLTIDDICKELNYYDDFKIGCIIARFENEGKIMSVGEKVVYRPDGAGILLGVYRRVK